MELKTLILSTLEELDAKIEEDARRGDMKDIVVAPQAKIAVGHEDEEAFLRHSKERFRVLFEGLRSDDVTKVEAKLTLVINFLQYYLSLIDTRLEELSCETSCQK